MEVMPTDRSAPEVNSELESEVSRLSTLFSLTLVLLIEGN